MGGTAAMTDSRIMMQHSGPPIQWSQLIRRKASHREESNMRWHYCYMILGLLTFNLTISFGFLFMVSLVCDGDVKLQNQDHLAHKDLADAQQCCEVLEISGENLLTSQSPCVKIEISEMTPV